MKSIQAAGYIEGSLIMPEGMLDSLIDRDRPVIDLIRYMQSIC